MSFYQRHVKRKADLAVSLLSLPFVCVVAATVAPIIKITDGGPILYKSERRGIHGTPFIMYKFRSMSVDAPDLRNADGSTYNHHRDPRVTKLGRFLRRTSLDELPQVVNVLRGDMSFVGPRPDMATRSWSELSENEKIRLTVRPGITGLSQVIFRNAAAPEERHEIDIEYVGSISLKLDLMILWKTADTVFRSRNVYSERRFGRRGYNDR